MKKSIFDGLDKKEEKKLFETLTESQFPPQNVSGTEQEQLQSINQKQNKQNLENRKYAYFCGGGLPANISIRQAIDLKMEDF